VSTPNNFCWGFVFLYMDTYNIFLHTMIELLLRNQLKRDVPSPFVAVAETVPYASFEKEYMKKDGQVAPSFRLPFHLKAARP
jgi:hypothetical protein